MKLLMAPATAIAAAITLAACGGTSSTTTAAGGAGGNGGSAGASTTVSTQQLPKVGGVLVDQSGKALYESDLEASGKVVCDGACTSFWKPLTLASGKPTAPAGAGKLGVITRPDGTRQVTDNGRPLYTFAEDSPGNAQGDGFTDDFAGHHFTWHVVHSGGRAGTTAAGSGGSSSSGGGGQSGGSGQSGSGGYGGSNQSGGSYGY